MTVAKQTRNRMFITHINKNMEYIQAENINQGKNIST